MIKDVKESGKTKGGYGGDGRGMMVPPYQQVKVNTVRPDGVDTEKVKANPHYSEEVQLRLVNLIYDPLATLLFKEGGIDPDEAHLLSLTKINSSREAWFWATQFQKEAAFNRYVLRFPCKWPLSRVLRVAFLLARRSIPGQMGPGFMLGVGLAQEQNIMKAEEAGEESNW